MICTVDNGDLIPNRDTQNRQGLVETTISRPGGINMVKHGQPNQSVDSLTSRFQVKNQHVDRFHHGDSRWSTCFWLFLGRRIAQSHYAPTASPHWQLWSTQRTSCRAPKQWLAGVSTFACDEVRYQITSTNINDLQRVTMIASECFRTSANSVTEFRR